MSSVNLTIELPEALIEEARAAGILSSERIAALLEMELMRQSAWDRLNQTAEIVRESASSEYGHLSDEEVMQLVNDEVHLMRSENSSISDIHNNDDQ
jgi:hypothetical protein